MVTFYHEAQHTKMNIINYKKLHFRKRKYYANQVRDLTAPQSLFKKKWAHSLARFILLNNW